MSDAGIVQELRPFFAYVDLLLVTWILGQIGVLSVRRWVGGVVPDYSGWEAQHMLADQRFGFGHGLALAAAWASVAIALIRRALQSGVIPLLPSHLGPLPIPQWLALILQEGHRLGITFALWVTIMWLDRSVSKHWSRPQPNRSRRNQGIFAMLLALLAVAASVLD
jgi:hypothetical protein